MNDISGITSAPAHSTLGTAILIDGENVSRDCAEEILGHLKPSHKITVKRVYGNVQNTKAWENASGFRLVHSQTAKNSADILLAIEAVDLSHTRPIGTFAIVSADRDYSHIATHLVERGFTVIGLSQQQPNEDFRSACTSFIQLEASPAKKAQPDSPHVGRTVRPKLDKLDNLLHELIGSAPKNKGLPLDQINAAVRGKCNFSIGKHPDKNWRTYLTNRPDLYVCDPRGPGARVRLTLPRTSG